MISSIITAFSRPIAAYMLLYFWQQYPQDVREPPIVASTIPFASALIGMAKKAKFYTDLRDKYRLPICTLRLPGSRIYIVNSIKLITAVQRHVRILDFAPTETRAAVNVMGASPAGTKILHMNRNGIGDHSYAVEFDKVIHPALSSGANLESINRSSVQKVAAFLDTLANETPVTVKLYEWIQKKMAWATTEAVYGPDNPFRDPGILDAFWTFESGIIVLLLQLFPTILASKSLQAGQKLTRAFDAYFRKAGHERGSALVRARYQHSVNYDFALDDIARFELGGAVAILTNTIPTSFWLLWHIVSDVVVLDDCRNELRRVCRTKEDGDTVTIDISEVKHSCPILVSAMQEVLRLHGVGTSVRVVQDDHLLNGQYLLKKGSTLMIPGPVQHMSKEIYGDNVHGFYHKRFMRTESKRPHPTAFRGFGGGSTLCPGRHFVSTEILAFVALMILRFDLEPADGSWIQPTTDHAGMQATVPPPDADVDVHVTLRGGDLAGKRWDVILHTTDKPLELVVEDIPEQSWSECKDSRP